MKGALRETNLYRLLSPEGRDLYQYVQERYPAWENSRWPLGTDRPGGMSRQDEAFRHLLRSVVEGVPIPRGWSPHLWADNAVASAARDPEVRRQAWTALASDDESGWKRRWVRRQRADRLGTALIFVGLAVALAVAVAVITESFWPVTAALSAVAIAGVTALVGHPRRARAVEKDDQ